MLTFMSVLEYLTHKVCRLEFTGNEQQQSVLANLSKWLPILGAMAK